MPLVTIFFLSCSISRIQHQGHTSPQSFYYKDNFSTIKTLIVLPLEIDGQPSRNFLFDTGADITLVQKDTIDGKTEKIKGASGRKMELGREIVESFKLGNIEFLNTYAWVGDFVGLKEQVPNFGGLIGQSIINKANWLIDYPNKHIEISNQRLIDDSYEEIKIIVKAGSPYTYITVDGNEHEALIDLGSSSAMSIPEESKLAKDILAQHVFQVIAKESYTLGGLQNTTQQTGKLPQVKIGSFTLENVESTVKKTSQLRLGNDFFKDFILYIDGINNRYYLKKI